MNAPSEPRQGFSLVELMVVLAIVGLTTGLALPAVASAFGAGTETDITEELATLLRSTHRMSIIRGSTIELYIDPSSGRWWIRDRRDPERMAHGRLELDAGARLRASSARVGYIFSPRGPVRSEPVTATTTTGRTVILSIDPWTGAVGVDR